MNDILFGKVYLEELESEIRATRHCLERIPQNLSGISRMKNLWPWVILLCWWQKFQNG